jgi:uncharacterized protein YndB with AHSA1/START domain
MSSTTVSKLVNAPRAAVYRACLDPNAVAEWRVPDNMTATVHRFDDKGYRMSLTYKDATPGKSGGCTDTFEGRFVELVPDEKIVEAIRFESHDASLAGEMRMTTLLTDARGGTEVTIVTDNLPAGVRPEDNEEGCRQSLAKLAKLLD